MSALQLIVTLLAATVCGVVAQRLGAPGGLILGAMVGASAVTLLTGRSVPIPPILQNAGFVVIGAAIGVQLTRQAMAQLGPVVAPALLSGGLIIVAGIGIAYLLRWLGISPPGDILATSPGALSVMSAMAVEQGTGAVEVALFHLVRIVLVITSLPLLVALLRAGP